MDRDRPDEYPARPTLRPAPAAKLAVLAAIGLAGPLAAAVHQAGGERSDPPGAVQTQRSDGSPDVDNALYYHLRASDLLPDDATTPEYVLRRFMERHTASDYLGAAEAAQELVRLVNDRPIAHYNLACAMARLGRVDETLDALNDAVACGWRNVAHTERDWDLALVRDDPRYQQIITWMRELIAREQPPSTPLRTDSLDEVLADLDTHAPQLLARYHVPGAAVALIRNGKVVWTGAFTQPVNADAESSATVTAMTPETIFRSGAPARMSAALSAAEGFARQDLSIAQLMIDQINGQVAARGLGDGDRARPVGISGQGELTRLRPAERSARAAALSGEAVMPAMNGWPASVVEPASFQLYCINIESRPDGSSFQGYCENRVFAPYRLANTGYHLEEDQTAKLVTGHTLLGTPLRQPKPARRANDLYCYTSVEDLGAMLESLMSEEATAATPGSISLVNTIQQLSKIVPGAGLGIETTETKDGLRVQLAEEHSGTGCLIRWYPETGDGIVIAFNAEAGPSAALRMAGVALGGNR